MTAQDVADLYEEIQNLQCALNFWLPSVPADCQDEKIMDRIFHDANLLAGYEGPVVECAEEIGWVTVTLGITTTSREPQP